MKTPTFSYSHIYVSLFFALTVIFSSCDSKIADSANNHLSKANSKTDSNIEINEITRDSSSVQLNSNLVFIPSSYDFKERSETTVQTYGFQLKNNGATSSSGQVFVYGDQPFSCYSGCSFSLAPSQSQYVDIEFAPCEIPYLDEIPYDATIYANNAQASVEGIGIDEVSGEPECEY